MRRIHGEQSRAVGVEADAQVEVLVVEALEEVVVGSEVQPVRRVSGCG
jgi:hypothetical protein